MQRAGNSGVGHRANKYGDVLCKTAVKETEKRIETRREEIKRNTRENYKNKVQTELLK